MTIQPYSLDIERRRFYGPAQGTTLSRPVRSRTRKSGTPAQLDSERAEQRTPLALGRVYDGRGTSTARISPIRRSETALDP